MANKRKYYLAYGSNLNIRQMRYRCPGAKVVGTAEIPDYQLLFKGSKTGAYLTIERQEGAKVPVAVWSVTARDEAMLDAYEGFPTFYYKKEMRVRLKPQEGSGKKERTVKAFVYIMHEERELGIPGKRYVDICMEGYRSFGFDSELLRAAIRNSMEGAETQ